MQALDAVKPMDLPRSLDGRMRKVKIAFDVDGTLRCNCTEDCREPNKRIVDMFNTLASFKNTEMFVWSGGGADYADSFARRYDLKVSSNHCVSKLNAPKMDIAIDDIQATMLGDINLIVREK